MFAWINHSGSFQINQDIMESYLEFFDQNSSLAYNQSKIALTMCVAGRGLLGSFESI
jgi:hypothetical protein